MSTIPPNSVSVFNAENAADDFPVLRAFQQYIDAEQAKARKRLLMLGIFFSSLMFIVIAVFVALLVIASDRNQRLNDRMVEYVMKERAQPVTVAPATPVVVQQPVAQPAPAVPSAELKALTDQVKELKNALATSQDEAEKARKEAAKAVAEAAKPKGPTPQELEIKRLRALLDEEKKKADAEKERQHQIELEAYRRQHWPELYEKKEAAPAVKAPVVQEEPKAKPVEKVPAVDPEKVVKPISYFDEAPSQPADKDVDALVKEAEKPVVTEVQEPVKEPEAPVKEEVVEETDEEPAETNAAPSQVPVKINGARTYWELPND